MNQSIRRFWIILFGLVLIALTACKQKSHSKSGETEIVVLGMIHSGHTNSKLYGIGQLKQIIRNIKPDIILTEIPPDRFLIAQEEFNKTGTVKEERVVKFPEYVDVIFPLTKEMNFEIIPTAGWTKEMAVSRQKRLKEISEDSLWSKRWQEYKLAEVKSDSLLAIGGQEDDPYFINSSNYDNAVELWAETYNRLFNEELGLGGWDNINKAHYFYIEKEIEDKKNKGKRILITYGAGHKGWLLKELRKRNDIRILDAKEYLEGIKPISTSVILP